jgi:nucleolar protein 53
MPNKAPARKTKQQRKKAARLLAEVKAPYFILHTKYSLTSPFFPYQKRALAERAAKKRMSATIDNVKSLSRAAQQALHARDDAREQRQLMLREKMKKGLGGQKLGKHKVPEGKVDVQLGEELSENLRTLKVRHVARFPVCFR